MENEYLEKLQIKETDFRLIFGRTNIDYDENKEEENKKKHGYSLESAVYFLTNALLPISSPRLVTSDAFEVNGEIRHMHMCKDEHGDIIIFVTTMRPNETVRVISLRRAHDNERKLYKALIEL